MGEVIPIKVLYKYLDFSKEPIKEWNDSTDLLRFLYRLHDKNESIIIDNQVEISANQMSYGKKVYDRGTKRLLDRSKKLKEVAKQNNILFSGGAEDKSEIIKFSEDPIFGWAAKYIIAWDGVMGVVLSEDAFFSITHILEAESDLKCSIELTTQLYYKQACQVLINFLKDLILPLYFCDDLDFFEKWKNGNYKIPPIKGEGGILYRLRNNGVLPDKTSDYIEKLYDALYVYVEGSEEYLINRGMHSDDWLGHSFKKQDFYNWCELIVETISIGIHLTRLNINQNNDLCS
ncbi:MULTISPECIES: hypothetical protein [unclassified Candidatus Frackibacter]|uniref:hypothetical protein n=1 Tax=unclassified Candidatus Frackibacter TaxID=2648818 RepID=UPI0008904DC3|nr:MULTISPECIES: hypothetical protein [unclassified Candidatus Frackibacter]SDC62300.1 hypothetical protein SAMN04515661_11648 [Candidatus Frackibacter sp. WG11]SEM76072.1 hypothetical protein SAMN04488698_11549 [Candidatus Frackibacter sp. WG12]SFL86351.1 hypothetical protein SAMN04488699_11721 [Candidatus Frackibacter sp. WG13]